MKPSNYHLLLILSLLALLAGCQDQSPSSMMPDNDADPDGWPDAAIRPLHRGPVRRRRPT